MLRAVLDPGVLIAALLSSEGAPADLLLAWRSGAFDLLLSRQLLDELVGVLLRPKFRRYTSEVDAVAYTELLRRGGVRLEDPPPELGLTADPGDDYLVALARAAKADALVSGDRHLLALAEVAHPPVPTPRQFLERLESRRPPGRSGR